MRLDLKTAPAARALDWPTEIQGHLRLDTAEEQARVLDVLVPAAEQWAESATGRQLITATWTLYLDAFPPSSECPLWLPKPPLQSVTSVKYYDADGALQTWSSDYYSVNAPKGDKAPPGWILPKVNCSYPSVYGSPYEVAIEFVAGYGSSHAAVPGLLRAGLLEFVAELFERREAVVIGNSVSDAPLTAKNLILPFAWEM